MNNGYGIAFNEWIFDERIKTELRLLIYISSLTAKNGYCFASNEYLAEKFKTTTITISRQINKLIDLGYLFAEYKRHGNMILKRKITINKNVNGGYQKCYSAVNKNVKDNNTSININNSVSQNETTFLDKNIYDLDREKTLTEIQDDKQQLHFRMAKALNNYFVNYCKQKGIKVKSSIKKAKASAEMNQMRLLLKDYSEDDIKKVMIWLINGKTPDAQFWQKNVFSCSGFRSKFEKMKLALETKPKQKQIQRL